MDTSETYVKMCEKAEEIQKKWKPKSGDYCFGKCVRHCGDLVSEPEVYRFAPLDDDCWYESIPVGWDYDKWEEKTDSIWLPTQDQFQQMVRPEKRSHWYLVELFANWCVAQKKDIPFAFYSMEQLWLAFVMKQRWNKSWNGENWVAV